jgi:GTP pyrophosphokinase
MTQNYPYRIVMARWTGGEDNAAFQTAVKVVGVDDHTMITRIHDVIASTKVTLRNFNYENKDGMFEGMIQLLVPNTNTLNGLVKKLQALDGMIKASRFSK